MDWQELLEASTIHYVAGHTSLDEGEHRKAAGRLLWQGAREAVRGYDPLQDPTGDHLYLAALAALTQRRKGSASKIRKVAVSFREFGLSADMFTSLDSAYRAAKVLGIEPVCVCPRCAFHRDAETVLGSSTDLSNR